MCLCLNVLPAFVDFTSLRAFALRTALGPSGKTCGAERQLHRQANLCVAFAGVFGSVRQLWSVSCSFSRFLCCGQCGVPFLHCKLCGRVLPSMMVSWLCLIMSLRCPATVAFCGFDLVLLPSCVLFGKRDFKPRGRPVASTGLRGQCVSLLCCPLPPFLLSRVSIAS